MVYSKEEERAWELSKFIEEITDDKPHNCEYCKWREIWVYSDDNEPACAWSMRNKPRGRLRKLPKSLTCENYKKIVSYARCQ